MSELVSLCSYSLCRITCDSLCQNWLAYVAAAYVESRVSTYVRNCSAYVATAYVELRVSAYVTIGQPM